MSCGRTPRDYCIDLVPRSRAAVATSPGGVGALWQAEAVTTTLLHGGRVHSPADPRATALLVDDASGTVLWVGGTTPAPASGPTARSTSTEPW